MKYLLFVILAVFSVMSVLGLRAQVPEETKFPEYWLRSGQKTLNAALRLRKIENKAKNVIMFLGDGMGITTITAMRIYKGQKHNRTGEDELLVFDEFPFVSLSKTYGVDRQTSDSANTATAYLCGVKANYGTIGVDGRVQYQNCSSSLDKTSHVSSILQWAQEEGKWTGVVTTTRVTHATPAGTYAHTASRDWESATPDPQCKDIADQLINELPGKDIRVILGGGIRHFIPFTEKDADGMNGSRTDSRNLINEWKDDKTTRNAKWKTAFDKKNLRDLKAEEVDYLLGLFHSDHLPYVADRPALNKEYPSLAEMTEAAIKVLSRSPNGFFLLVEGGSIDLAHHMNFALKALEEGYEFDKAIQTALRLTNQEDTLIVVTADHSHTFTVGGDYPMRGSDILGIGGVSDVDNKTFTTLGYHNGPGYKPDARSRNLTEEEAIKKDFQQDSAFPMQYETHGAEDVAVYAKGPMAHLFHGVHEQSYIPYVMGYASCIGPNQDLCSSAWSYLIPDQWTAFLRFATVGLTTYVFNLQSLH